VRSFDFPARRTPSGALVVVALLACAAFALRASAADEDPKPVPKPKTWHVSTFGSGGSGYRIVHYWSKGPLLRAQTLIAGHPVVTIVRGDRYLVLDMLLMKGVEIRRAPAAQAEDAKHERPFGEEFEALKREHGEKIGEEEISGRPAEVWRVTDPAGRRTVWVTKSEPKVPLRIEAFDRASGATVNIDYSNWIFDLPMSDAFFEPPAGMPLETFEYEDYMARSAAGKPDPAPIFFPHLLHGPRPR
jgi:hypothetical protein